MAYVVMVSRLRDVVVLGCWALFLCTVKTHAFENESQVKVNSYPFQPMSFKESNKLKQHNILNLTETQLQFSEDYCQLVMLNLGWLSCGQVQVLSSGSVDAMLHPPAYTQKDKIAWGTKEQKQMMIRVETQMIDRLQTQSNVLGLPIFFQGWIVEPQMNPTHQYIYYATHSLWNEQQVIHLQAETLDNSKYMIVSIEAPNQNNKLTSEATLRLMTQIMSYYQENVK
tara:strand:+ start:6444 stop:7121 length:678 start_codon:yes stop_codon:yes gene_type:complete